jgi:hypothetical protein
MHNSEKKLHVGLFVIWTRNANLNIGCLIVIVDSHERVRR